MARAARDESIGERRKAKGEIIHPRGRLVIARGLITTRHKSQDHFKHSLRDGPDVFFTTGSTVTRFGIRLPAGDRIFDIGSFSGHFCTIFQSHRTGALEGRNCGGKLLFARTVIIARAGVRALLRARVENRSRSAAPGCKNDVCADTRITSDFPKRVTASFIGHFGPARVCSIFAIPCFIFPRSPDASNDRTIISLSAPARRAEPSRGVSAFSSR